MGGALEAAVVDLATAIAEYRKAVKGSGLEIEVAGRRLASALNRLLRCDGAVTGHGLLAERIRPLVAPLVPEGVIVRDLIRWLGEGGLPRRRPGIDGNMACHDYRHIDTSKLRVKIDMGETRERCQKNHVQGQAGNGGGHRRTGQGRRGTEQERTHRSPGKAGIQALQAGETGSGAGRAVQGRLLRSGIRG